MHGKYTSIDDLPLDNLQKVVVLEYLADRLITILEGVFDESFVGKSYDPLTIEYTPSIECPECGVAHSYVFNLWDGGRHHDFRTFRQLEDGMIREIIEDIKSFIQEVKHGYDN